jgi:hypothetical protein
LWCADRKLQSPQQWLKVKFVLNKVIHVKNKNLEMKKLLLLLILIAFQQQIFAQGVGINTTSPDPSAALDIQSTNKGILIPKVALTHLTDKTTIANPANSLMVYNTNVNLTYGAGYYFNEGTANSPSWVGLSKLTMPYYYGGSSTTPLLQIDNYNNTDVGLIAIKGYGAGSNTGVYAKSDNRFALEVDGRMRIFGNGQAPGLGKVLTSDASGNATWQGGVAFSTIGVDGAGEQVLVPENSVFKVPFNEKRYDISDNYSAADHSFTAPVNGIYHFDTQVSWFGSSAQVDLRLMLVRNGQLFTLVNNVLASSVNTSSVLSVDQLLQKGDTVYVAIFRVTGSQLILNQELVRSFFNGRLVFHTP